MHWFISSNTPTTSCTASVWSATISRACFAFSTLFTVWSVIWVTLFWISPAASAEWSASFLISSATTANPLPASPALAASMEAFKESRFVCSEISVIVSTNSLIISDSFLSSSILVSTLIVTSVVLVARSPRVWTICIPWLIIFSASETNPSTWPAILLTFWISSESVSVFLTHSSACSDCFVMPSLISSIAWMIFTE